MNDQRSLNGDLCERWRNHHAKVQVEDCVVIDAARGQREGVLHEGSTCSRTPFFGAGYRVDATDMSCPYVHLTYSLNRQHFEYPVSLETTRPHLGGLRWSFLCPLCERRAQKLFHPPDAERFACRTCHKLSYASRSYGLQDRSMERARKIQMRLGGSVSLFDPFPAKPKGMWQKTYARLSGRCATHEATMTRLLMEHSGETTVLHKREESNAKIVADLAGVVNLQNLRNRQRRRQARRS